MATIIQRTQALTDEAALLDTLASGPDDPAAQAAYSDWLEERGRTPPAPPSGLRSLTGSAAAEALRYWLHLAVRPDQSPDPEAADLEYAALADQAGRLRTARDAARWATRVRALAERCERGNRPQAWAEIVTGGPVVALDYLTVGWSGTWTAGRWVEITWRCAAATVEWDTGTGRPSRFLAGVDRLGGQP